MALINVQFLVNDNTGEERLVESLPQNYQYSPHERLVSRQVTEEEFALLQSDKFKRLKIYRYVDDDFIADRTVPPKGLNYNTGINTRLHSVPFISEIGFLETMDFYAKAEFNAETNSWDYSDKIVSERVNYNIDPQTKYVVSRVKEITWYKEDGTPHPDTKEMFKTYNILEMEEEAIRRRSNIISSIKIELAKFGHQLVVQQYPDPNTRPDSNEMVKDISAPFNTSMRNYIDAGAKDGLIQKLDATTDTFFDTNMPQYGMTVREYIKSRIS